MFNVLSMTMRSDFNQFYIDPLLAPKRKRGPSDVIPSETEAAHRGEKYPCTFDRSDKQNKQEMQGFIATAATAALTKRQADTIPRRYARDTTPRHAAVEPLSSAAKRSPFGRRRMPRDR